jgi:hypothetical protein
VKFYLQEFSEIKFLVFCFSCANLRCFKHVVYRCTCRCGVSEDGELRVESHRNYVSELYSTVCAQICALQVCTANVYETDVTCKRSLLLKSNTHSTDWL